MPAGWSERPCIGTPEDDLAALVSRGFSSQGIIVDVIAVFGQDVTDGRIGLGDSCPAGILTVVRITLSSLSVLDETTLTCTHDRM
ncbi:MAG: hypothetical protein ACI9BK_003179 [Acidimicrobiales bacterium]